MTLIDQRLNSLRKRTNSVHLGREQTPSRQFVLDHPHQHRHFPDHDRDRNLSARQAAEALFAPKPDVTEQPVSDPGQPAVNRKPRVLSALPPAPIRDEAVTAATPEEGRAPLEIPAGKVAQLRTLAKYGMTVPQLAELHRVPAETIKRVLWKP
jgi:hypothetical protein